MSNEHLSEKVSVNINTSTLSGIDLLVDNGYYSNRSDFINQALRQSLQQHQNTLDRIIESQQKAHRENDDQWFIGVCGLEKLEIEADRAAGKKRTVRGYGVLVIGSEVDEEALFEVVEAIQVRGKVICRKSIKAHYGLK